MVGGTIGEKRREDQKVVIAIGLAKFVAKNGPPSLDGSFQDFFVRKVHIPHAATYTFYATLLYVNCY